MEGTDDTPAVDGRTARRERNVDAVLTVVQELFAEDAMFPTMEQVATRSGLSLRSLYRYFADPTELIEATVEKTVGQARAVAEIDDMGEGPLDHRVEVFVASRLRLHHTFGAAQQAALFNAFDREPARKRVDQNRALMRQQLELQFEPELSSLPEPRRAQVLAAADVLTQLESISYLRKHRELSPEATGAVLAEGLRALLDQ